MCKKINEKLKESQPLMIGALLVIVIALIILLVSGRSYAMTLQMGDKQISITPPNLEIAFGEFGESMVEIFKIENQYKPREQEAYLKDIMKPVRQRILDRHVEYRKKKGTDKDCYADPDYQAYVNITDLCLNDLKEMAMADFYRLDKINKQNEAEELNLFIKNCIAKYITDYGELVKKRWSLHNMTSDENYQWTRAIVPAIADDIDNIIRQAYKIKVKYDKEIETLKSKKVTIQSNYK